MAAELVPCGMWRAEDGSRWVGYALSVLSELSRRSISLRAAARRLAAWSSSNSSVAADLLEGAGGGDDGLGVEVRRGAFQRVRGAAQRVAVARASAVPIRSR